jgi:DNA-binding CsgD family transcriptional regulator
LVGRSHEQERLAAVVERARQGMSAALVVHGEAGIGKTALVEDLVASAPDLSIASVTGVESEVALGFAALHRLLVPWMSSVDRLPSRQRHALQAAFGIVEDGRAPSDRFLVGLAVLTLLAEVAAARPMLCVIDDAHWVDHESLEVLSFVGRRLEAEGIALVLVMRDPTESGVRLPEGLPALALAGLAEADARDLLATAASAPVAPEVAARIVAETGGSPLALVELARALADEQLAGRGLLPEALPLGTRLESHYLQQVRGLAPSTQTALLLAAAEPSTDSARFWLAAGTLGITPDTIDPDELEGLLTLVPEVAFRHPLIRSAVYNGAPAAERRRAHAALARAVDRTADPDRWAWHQAAASVGPDEDVAAELERAADRTGRRGGDAAAASFRARAAELTPDRHRRARRRLAAAHTNLTAGAPKVARQLLESATPDLDDAVLRAEARRLDAQLRSFTTPGKVPAVLLAAARTIEELDVRLARDTYADALQTSLLSCQLTVGTTMVEIAEASLAAPGVAPERRTIADVLLEAFATRLAVGYAAAVPALRQAVRMANATDVDVAELHRWTTALNTLAPELWDDEGTRRMLLRRERDARDRGALGTLRVVLGGVGHGAMLEGRFADSMDAHSEAVAIAVAAGADPAGWEMPKVQVLAWQGRELEARQMVDVLTNQVGFPFGAGMIVNMARSALVTLELGLGNHREALDLLRLAYDDDCPPYGNECLPRLVEAAVRCGELDVAHAALDRLTERARASGTPWALGLLARSEALLQDGEDAERSYAEAIAQLRRTRIATELARTHLLHGEWLRRGRRRADARSELRTAHEMFAAMGARAYAERARTELLATGERVRSRTVETSTVLTPQETQVARLAAGGATNREIAARMFLSPATVDFHLRKVYRKVGVSSRRQLRQALPGGAAVEPLPST